MAKRPNKLTLSDDIVNDRRVPFECSECKHDEHEAGKCKQCNCGESERVHSLNDDVRLHDPVASRHFEGDYVGARASKIRGAE